MNFSNLIFAQIMTFISLFTAAGVLVHDTHIDRAFTSALYKPQASDLATDAQARPSSNLHPHAEHLTLTKDQASPKALPRDRNKRIREKQPTRGYHGDNVCMPLAGEWV